MAVTSTLDALVNDRWLLRMTPDRAEFHAKRPSWESGRLARMAEMVKPGQVVYDVGAECGDFTALYAQWVTGPVRGLRPGDAMYPDDPTMPVPAIAIQDVGKVVPFEPKPEMWPSIRAHLEANGFGPPRAWFPGFASDNTNLGDIDALDATGWPMGDWPACSVGPVTPDPGFLHLAEHGKDVPQIRLDAFADMADLEPDHVVIDVEGAEWHVLSGCEYLLRVKRPTFWVSVHDVGDDAGWHGNLWGTYHKTADDLDALMFDADYIRSELPANGEGERFFLYEPKERA